MTAPRKFTLVRSARARRLSLHVHPERGLEAVVPARLSEERARREAEAFIVKRARWIDRAIAELAERRATLGTDGLLEINGMIPYGGRAHKIIAAAVGSIHVNNGAIEVPAAIARDPALLRRRLSDWLRRRARAVATQMIDVYAPQMRVAPKRLRLADQTTLWGSCSPDGTISLSWRLILAPPSCFEAVVVHELAHLRSRGHGPRFRAVVERHLPDEAERMRELQRIAPALGAVK